MLTSFDAKSTRLAAGPAPSVSRAGDGDYRVKLFKAASRAGREDVERSAAALAERLAADSARSMPQRATDPHGRYRR
jgi:hypothetical protein